MMLGLSESVMDDVGVKVGHWVKYNVIRIGQSSAWVPPPIKKATWIHVKVQNVSDAMVIISETIHLPEGNSSTRTISLNLGKEIRLGYIIAANLDKGDKILVNRVVAINSTYLKHVKELSINATVSKSYYGLNREVNVLKWSYLMPFFQRMYNFTEEYYWDKKTGFLLERIWQMYALGYRNGSLSTLQLKVSETNIWKIETSNELPLKTLLPWVAVGLVLATVTSTTILMKLLKKPRKEVYN
jgi:hypothetical protein